MDIIKPLIIWHCLNCWILGEGDFLTVNKTKGAADLNSSSNCIAPYSLVQWNSILQSFLLYFTIIFSLEKWEESTTLCAACNINVEKINIRSLPYDRVTVSQSIIDFLTRWPSCATMSSGPAMQTPSKRPSEF